MSDNQNLTEETPNPEITPIEAEKRVSTAVSQVVPEAPDSLLIEEDGDPFWVIQKVFWGIIKTAALLGILLFLIWLVWRPSSLFSDDSEVSFEVEPTPQTAEIKAPEPSAKDEESGPGFWQRLFGSKDEAPTTSTPAPANSNTTNATNTASTTNKAANTNPVPETTPVETSRPTVNASDPTGAEIAYEVEENRTQLVRGILPESVNWLRRAKTIGEISLSMVREAAPAVRSQHVESILAESDKLFVESANLQVQLQAERDYFLTQGQTANQQTEILEEQISQSLRVLDPLPLDRLLQAKVKAQQEASYFLSNAKIRDTLLQNIQTFDALLRQQSIPLLNPATELRAS